MQQEIGEATILVEEAPEYKQLREQVAALQLQLAAVQNEAGAAGTVTGTFLQQQEAAENCMQPCEGQNHVCAADSHMQQVYFVAWCIIKNPTHPTLLLWLAFTLICCWPVSLLLTSVHQPPHSHAADCDICVLQAASHCGSMSGSPCPACQSGLQTATAAHRRLPVGQGRLMPWTTGLASVLLWPLLWTRWMTHRPCATRWWVEECRREQRPPGRGLVAPTVDRLEPHSPQRLPVALWLLCVRCVGLWWRSVHPPPQYVPRLPPPGRVNNGNVAPSGATKAAMHDDCTLLLLLPAAAFQSGGRP